MRFKKESIPDEHRREYQAATLERVGQVTAGMWRASLDAIEPGRIEKIVSDLDLGSNAFDHRQ